MHSIHTPKATLVSIKLIGCEAVFLAPLLPVIFHYCERYSSPVLFVRLAMGRNPDLSKETLTRIHTLHKAGYTVSQICKETGVSKRSVQRWVKKCRAAVDGGVPSQKKRPGPQHSLSVKTLRVIKRQLTSSPTLTARELKEKNPNLLSSVSVRCVSRYLKEQLDLPSRRAARKPLLKPYHKVKRLAFARKYLAWPIANIRTILWSDESTFTVTGTSLGRVRRPRNSDRYDPRYTIKTVKHPQHVMVWGAFSYYGVSKLHFLDKGESMNTSTYLNILMNYLPECFVNCNSEVFMQDNASCHTSKAVLDWFTEYGVHYIDDWPGNSPDLNPIENLWNIVKKELREQDTSTLPKLKAAIEKAWNNLPTGVIHKLVDSVPRRLTEVIKKKGNVTKY